MDQKKAAAATAVEGSGAEGWTEERHASYLNKIEERFVRTMLAGAGGGGGGGIMTPPPSLRLDRHVPDSATESNRDRATAATDSGTQNLAARNHNTNKKRILPQRDASQDQVVPEKPDSPKNKRGGKQVSGWR